MVVNSIKIYIWNVNIPTGIMDEAADNELIAVMGAVVMARLPSETDDAGTVAALTPFSSKTVRDKLYRI